MLFGLISVFCQTQSIKDYFPLIGTALTIVAGYYGISRQVNKNRRAKWIEDFRREVSNFASLVMVYTPNDLDTLKKIVQSASILQLFLDKDDSDQKQLSEVIAAVVHSASTKDFKAHSLEYPTQFQAIITLTKNIINREQNKI